MPSTKEISMNEIAIIISSSLVSRFAQSLGGDDKALELHNLVILSDIFRTWMDFLFYSL